MTRPKFDPQRHHRRSIRLKGYDYSQAGAYFVTIVTYQRECLFGQITNGKIKLNDLGNIAEECWCAIPEHFPFVELGAYVVMPNHVHGIIIISENAGAQGRSMLRPYCARTLGHQNFQKFEVTPGSLGAIMRSYKSAVSYRINKEYHATGIWQRNYYERIIRSEREMQNIWKYIESNPSRWAGDAENRACKG